MTSGDVRWQQKLTGPDGAMAGLLWFARNQNCDEQEMAIADWLTDAAGFALWGWRGASIAFGIPAIVIAIAILILIRESGTDRAAARASGTLRQAFSQIVRDRDMRWLYLTSVLGGGGRGVGVVNLFVLLYLTRVLNFGESLSGLMYGALIVFAVPMPLIAGWLSDRVGRKPVIIGVYVGGAAGFLVFMASGSNLLGLWIGIANPVVHQVPVLGKYFDIGPVPMSGATTTVKQTTRALAPSMRMTADLADWDRSLLNIPIGQSGQIFSSHYKDQWDAYYNARSYPMQFLNVQATSTLEFRPAVR